MATIVMNENEISSVKIQPVSNIFQIFDNIGKLPKFKLHEKWSLYDECTKQLFFLFFPPCSTVLEEGECVNITVFPQHIIYSMNNTLPY